VHGRRRSPPAAACLDRRRRAARSVPRARRHSAAARAAPHSRAGRDQRRSRDPERVARAVPPVDRRVNRRPAAGARRAALAGDLRSHPKHIEGHSITVHCTVTRQQVNRAGYLEDFLKFWTSRTEVQKVWFSLYTPQIGEVSEERLRPADRARVVEDMMALRLRYPKLALPKGLLEVYADPPSSPDDCVFARSTTTLSADLTTKITPCQYGGAPDCSQCGCIASAGLAAVARHQLFGFIPVGMIFNGSLKVGETMRRLRPIEPTPA